jgi:hypothetical protein
MKHEDFMVVKEREGWRLGTTPSSLNLVGMGSYRRRGERPKCVQSKVRASIERGKEFKAFY